jgi:polyhydroxyalkanoate synthesis regulator phasin
MAYHESMLVFAGALHGQTVGAGPVNVDFARDAVQEMRRSFDQMKKQNEKYMATISDEVRANTTAMMQELETNRADLNVQLTALETEVKVDIPDATKVSSLAAAVHGRLASMSKAHQTKMSMTP